MFPSSKLLPAAAVTILAALGVKFAVLIAFAPSLDSFRSEATEAIVAAGDTASTSVITRANAASAEVAPPGPVQRPPATTEPAQAPASRPPPSERSEATRTAPSEIQTPPPDLLKVRRSPTDERERQLNQREAMMAAADKRLTDRVAELIALQSNMQALESNLKQRDEANWAGLVKLYEGMRPKEAAAIFNALDKSVLLDILDRMKSAKAAPVIAAMETEKARQVTADLAIRRTKSVTVTN